MSGLTGHLVRRGLHVLEGDHSGEVIIAQLSNEAITLLAVTGVAMCVIMFSVCCI
jgi:hypothetical protein